MSAVDIFHVSAGDPIEVGALGQALAVPPGRRTHVTLGKVPFKQITLATSFASSF